MPEKFANEDYRRKLNLSPEQQVYDSMYNQCFQFREGRIDLPFAAVGFKPSVPRKGDRNNSVRPIRADRLVLKTDEVTGVVMARTLRRKNRQGSQAARDLLVWECPLSPHRGSGEVYLTWDLSSHSERRRGYQVNFLVNPRQDVPVFEERAWEPGQLIPQEAPEIKAPTGGVFQVHRDDMYVNLTVNGHLAYRVARCHEASLEFSAEGCARPAGNVSKGDVLAKVVGPILLGEACFDQRGRPVVRKVSPPTLAASRKVHLFRMANRMLNSILAVSGQLMDTDGPATFAPLEEWGPVSLIEFSLDKFLKLRTLPGWSETPELWSAIRKGVSAEGDFYVRSTLRGVMKFAREVEMSDGLKALEFEDTSGPIHRIVVPDSVEVLESIRNPETHVRHGDPIADWVPRRHYENTRALRLALGKHWEIAVEAFLSHAAIWPRESGRNDHEVLIDCRLAASVAKHAKETRYGWLDFRACAPYLDEEQGFIVPPPIPHADPNDRHMIARGVGYDLTPLQDHSRRSSPVRRKGGRRDKAAQV